MAKKPGLNQVNQAINEEVQKLIKTEAIQGKK